MPKINSFDILASLNTNHAKLNPKGIFFHNIYFSQLIQFLRFSTDPKNLKRSKNQEM